MRVALDQFADAASLRTSVTGLADWMKKLFGERAEPWMIEGTPSLEMPADFDKTDTGLAVIPSDMVEETPLPKSLATTRNSLIEHARLSAISSNLEPTPKPAMKIPSLTGKRTAPPPTPVKAVMTTTPVNGMPIATSGELLSGLDEDKTDISGPPTPAPSR